MTLSKVLSVSYVYVPSVKRSQRTDRDIIFVPLHGQDSPALLNEVWSKRCLTPFRYAAPITPSSVAVCTEAASAVFLDCPSELIAPVGIQPAT